MTRLALTALVLTVAAPASAQESAAPDDVTFFVRDVAVGASGMGGPGSGPFALISLRDGRVVPNADSASTAWDLGFRGTEVIVNGGTSGPGEAAAVLLDAPFDEVTALPPASALLADGERECLRGPAAAVCSGSGNGWYLYESNGVRPVPGQTLAVRLADGEGAAKVRFVSYYRGAPDEPGTTEPRFYTLEVAPLAPCQE
jgi:hypothetical protein